MAEKQNINVSILAALGSICTILLIVAIVGLQAWFYDERNTLMDETIAASPNTDLQALRLQQQERINAYRAVNVDENVYAIPIDVAMQRVIEKHREKTNADAE